jgi:hypothetical protein
MLGVVAFQLTAAEDGALGANAGGEVERFEDREVLVDE